MTEPKSKPMAKRRAKAFDPVPVRARHDGWTRERQIAFIEALAECGCVGDACRRVGMSAESAYRLRRRFDAQGFRLAWDAALDYAIRRLSDAAFSRAIHGVPVPHYYKGEVVGEHRRYDNRLTMFLLRHRDPLHYGPIEGAENNPHDELFAVRLARYLGEMESDRLDDAARARWTRSPRPKVQTPQELEQEIRADLERRGPLPPDVS